MSLLNLFSTPGTPRSMLVNIAIIVCSLVAYARTTSLVTAGCMIALAVHAALLLGYDLGKHRWKGQFE